MSLCEISLLPVSFLSLSQVLIGASLSSVIEKSVVNVSDSIPTKEKATQTPLFDINPFRLGTILSNAIRSLVGLGFRKVKASHSEKPQSLKIL
jgi:hypothetical protein